MVVCKLRHVLGGRGVGEFATKDEVVEKVVFLRDVICERPLTTILMQNVHTTLVRTHEKGPYPLSGYTPWTSTTILIKSQHPNPESNHTDNKYKFHAFYAHKSFNNLIDNIRSSMKFYDSNFFIYG